MPGTASTATPPPPPEKTGKDPRSSRRGHWRNPVSRIDPLGPHETGGGGASTAEERSGALPDGRRTAGNQAARLLSDPSAIFVKRPAAAKTPRFPGKALLGEAQKQGAPAKAAACFQPRHLPPSHT